MLPLGDEELIARLQPRLRQVEDRLLAAVSGTDTLVDAPASHLARAGGKRLRPALTLLAAELGRTSPQVIDAAVAVELTHLATLYHDDVMDSAVMRRGAQAVHEVWGNTVAILTGDLLLARASRVVAGLGPEAVLIQAETFERLCLGQLHETLGPAEDEDPIDHYLQVLADKTGSLIAAAARYGVMFSGAADALATTLERYGEKVGVAFQLADDVIDLASDAQTTGKTPGTDLREGVATMPVLLLRQRAAEGRLDPAGEQVLAALAADLDSDQALARAVELLRNHEVLDEARRLAQRWADEAVAELGDLPEGTVKNALVAFAGLMVDRLA